MSTLCSRANYICLYFYILHWIFLIYTHKSLHYIYICFNICCMFIYLYFTILVNNFTYSYIFVCSYFYTYLIFFTTFSQILLNVALGMDNLILHFQLSFCQIRLFCKSDSLVFACKSECQLFPLALMKVQKYNSAFRVGRVKPRTIII